MFGARAGGSDVRFWLLRGPGWFSETPSAYGGGRGVMDLPEQTEVVVSTLEELKRLHSWELARHVDGVSDQLKDSSPGGVFLRDVRDAWAEIAESYRDQLDDYAPDGCLIATYDQWEAFVDLAAWERENVSGEPWDASDLPNLACAVLCQVAFDLVSALTGDLDDVDEDEDEE